jgi:PEP-CTERM motif
MRLAPKTLCSASLLVALLGAGNSALAVPVTLTKLTGLTGAGVASTAVYAANLNSLAGSFAAIVIGDSGTTVGGSPGQFSGFDLDSIKLSFTNCATAACAQTAVGLNVFDFLAGTVFTPGAQRAPADAKLFGTGAGGNTVNNTVASLGAFDAISSTAADATGFVSLGDGGSVGFNLTSITLTDNLFLYIGEVGDNGEAAASNINLSDTPIPAIPEPSTVALMILGLGGVVAIARRRKQ